MTTSTTWKSIWSILAAFIVVVVLSLGTVAAMKGDIGPLWYPIALAISSPITAWIGGTLSVRNHPGVRA